MTPETIHTVATGRAVAEAAWQMPDSLMQKLLPDAPAALYSDVRSQFALWASTPPASLDTFPGGIAEAWNRFTAPRTPGGQRAAVLPGSPCTKCSTVRFIAASSSARGYHTCSVCKGTRRKPPTSVRALPLG